MRWPGWPAYDSAALSEAFRRAVLRSSSAAADRPFALRHRRCVAETAAPEWPTAGTTALDPLEFLARLLTHIPDPGQVMTRYYGWYASRTRGTRARLAHSASDGRRLTADGLSVEEPVAITDPVHWSLRAARYRWAELLRRSYEVDPLACPRCAALLRIVAVITDPAVITRILVHRARGRERARPSRSPPPGRRRQSALATGGPPR